MNEVLFDFYSRPQAGGEMPYLIGQRYNQVGGGFLGNVGRFLLPILKTVGKKILGIGAETLHDVVNKKKPITESIAKNTAKRLRKVINKNHEMESETDEFSRNNL